jgi:hypothetical protein
VSDGGNSITGGSIGDIIRIRGMNTYVGPNASCASICAFIWLAGRAKFASNSAHVGFHGAYSISDTSLPLCWLMTLINSARGTRRS